MHYSFNANTSLHFTVIIAAIYAFKDDSPLDLPIQTAKTCVYK